MTVAEKRLMIEADNEDLSVSRQCELLGLPRSSYYRNQAPESLENDKLMRLIDEEYTRHPFLGSRGMRDYLRRQGYKVNRKRVRRLMQVMGLSSIAPQKRTSVPAPGHKVYPYLLRKLNICRPDQVWCSDITYSAPSFRWHKRDLSMSGIHLEKGGNANQMTALRCGRVRAEAAVTCCTLAG